MAIGIGTAANILECYERSNYGRANEFDDVHVGEGNGGGERGSWSFRHECGKRNIYLNVCDMK